MTLQGTRLYIVRSLTGRFICIGDVEHIFKAFALTKDQLDKIPHNIRDKGESVVFTKGNTLSIRACDAYTLWQIAKEIDS